MQYLVKVLISIIVSMNSPDGVHWMLYSMVSLIIAHIVPFKYQIPVKSWKKKIYVVLRPLLDYSNIGILELITSW